MSKDRCFKSFAGWRVTALVPPQMVLNVAVKETGCSERKVLYWKGGKQAFISVHYSIIFDAPNSCTVNRLSNP